jgi:hypothetical protein
MAVCMTEPLFWYQDIMDLDAALSEKAKKNQRKEEKKKKMLIISGCIAMLTSSAIPDAGLYAIDEMKERSLITNPYANGA